MSLPRSSDSLAPPPVNPRSNISVTLRWGGHTLAHEQLSAGKPFEIGGHDSWALPEPWKSGATRLIEWDERGRPWLLLSDGFAPDSDIWQGEMHHTLAQLHEEGTGRLLLEDGCSASLRVSTLTVELSCQQDDVTPIARPKLPWRSWAISALVGLVMSGGLFASKASMPYDWQYNGRETEREEQAHRFLVRAHERIEEAELAEMEAESEQRFIISMGLQAAGTGTRAKGQEGSMGQPNAQGYGSGSGHRYGVAGPANRGKQLAEAAEFGMIGMLGAGAGGDRAAAPWGRDDSLGIDPLAKGGHVVSPSGYTDHGINGPVDPHKDRVSTFAIDVDTGSYSLARRQLRGGALPPPGSVRAEEFINYFDYDYPTQGDQSGPLTAHINAAPSPFESGHHLVRVALQAKRPNAAQRKPVHLVYLVDTSGSMQSRDKIGLAMESLKILTESLKPGDTVALCTYAGDTREVLKPTDVQDKQRIMLAIQQLAGGGGTAMQSGMATAYKLASDSFVKGHVNRVVVLSDGDANIGPQQPKAILETIKQYREQGITLSTIGFGTGNYRDDMMEQLADAGDGNYSYVDNWHEARRVFSDHVDGLLEVVARDVKLQVEFDPRVVRSYRLIGYENRDVADKDFRNDKVDGGEVGMGHNVTALYDVVLRPRHTAPEGTSWVTVRVRHKQPEGQAPAMEAQFNLRAQNIATRFNAAPRSFRLAVAAGGFAEVLRKSPYAGDWHLTEVARIAANVDSQAVEVTELRDLINNARQHSL